MKAIFRCLSIFIKQIARDSMLYVMLAVPILAGLVFRFGIPKAEYFLCEYFGQSTILFDYYLLFDLLLTVLAPIMLCFVSSMVMLSELDENMVNYIAVTPVGKKGYIISRLIIPAAFSVPGSVVLLSFCSLTKWDLLPLILACLLTGILSISACLLIVTLSHNRVEGMAIGKLSGLIMLGLPIPFFLLSDIQYAFSFMPSFWIAKMVIDDSFLFAVPALLISVIWVWFLYGKFKRKVA